MRSPALLAAALSLGALLAWWAWPEPPEDRQAQVLAVLDAAAEAAERRDLGGLMDLVSDDFEGRGLDRRTLTGFLYRELRRGAWRGVTLLDRSVRFPAPDTADVQTRALLTTGTGLDLSAGAWDLSLTLRREPDGAWRLRRADWARSGGR